MTAHLLQIAIGPVQELIERARRTRDLWFGSYLLSEISKAAARSIKPEEGKLIFPWSDSDLSQISVANIIVAELYDKADPGTVAAAAKAAMLGSWRQDFADPVFKEYQAVIRHAPEKNIWKDQVDDIFEFYAAWVPFDPGNPDKDHYKKQRERLGRLMAGRKNCRDFLPAKGRDGVPKSSLDGLRETVLKDDEVEPWPEKTRRRLRVRTGEQLDVLGLVKRTASDDEDKPVSHRHYPSVSRVAADPWLRGIAKMDEGRQTLERLRQRCAGLRGARLLHAIDVRDFPQYDLFPYEGSVLYRTRHHELEEELSDREEDFTPLFEAMRAGLSIVERTARDAGLGAEPDPYVAVIVADGDRMGKAISSLQTPGEHRAFSNHLATFAQMAKGVVQVHQGVLVYSGGDDVLAFAPVDRCLSCARELYELFRKTMRPALPDRVKDDELPTLSVGAAIGHFLENLEDLLAFGRAAEKHAKKGKPERNALAVHLHKRGGAPVAIRKQWEHRLDLSVAKYASWFRDGLMSNRIPYELHRLADLYDDWPADTRKDAIRKDAVRVIEKKRPGGEKTQQMQEIRAEVERCVTKADDLREFARELLVARQFAVALRQSGAPKEAKP